MGAHPISEEPDPICIAIADDDPELLTFVKNWVSDLPNVQTLTCEQSQEFGSAIRAKILEMKAAPYDTAKVRDGKVRILIFLDLIWGPGHDVTPGLTLLSTLRSDPELRCCPIIMYSQTNSDDEISQCYCNQASAFLTKGPHNGLSARDRFRQVIETWRMVMTLPLAGDHP